jgi:hypothetical protein
MLFILATWASLKMGGQSAPGKIGHVRRKRTQDVHPQSGVGLATPGNEVKMTNKLLLVDFENVQQVDLTRIGDNFHVVIFVGSGQKSVPIDLVTSA